MEYHGWLGVWIVGYGSDCTMGYGSGYGSWGMDRVWARALDPYLAFWLAPIYIQLCLYIYIYIYIVHLVYVYIIYDRICINYVNHDSQVYIAPVIFFRERSPATMVSTKDVLFLPRPLPSRWCQWIGEKNLHRKPHRKCVIKNRAFRFQCSLKPIHWWFPYVSICFNAHEKYF